MYGDLPPLRRRRFRKRKGGRDGGLSAAGTKPEMVSGRGRPDVEKRKLDKGGSVLNRMSFKKKEYRYSKSANLPFSNFDIFFLPKLSSLYVN